MTRLFPVLLATLLTTSVVVAGATFASSTAQASPTELDSCTTITEPGHYVLSQNLTQEANKTCVEITASNVVLDGAGYTIDGRSGDRQSDGRDFDHDNPKIGVLVHGNTELVNVTVTNLTVTEDEEHGGVGILYENVTQSRITETTLPTNERGILLRNVSESTITDNRIGASSRESSDAGITLIDSSTNTLVENHIEEYFVGVAQGGNSTENTIAENTLNITPGGSIRLLGNGNTTVRNNHIVTGARMGGPTAVDIRSDNNRITSNTITASNSEGIVVKRASNNTISNNTISPSGSQGSTGVRLVMTANTTVVHNTIEENQDGIVVTVPAGRITIEFNTFVNNDEDGIELRDPECEPQSTDAEPIEIHDNIITGNGEYGILNRDDAPVNATQNYWGAEDGPGSPVGDADSPLEDPVTGTLADGSGDVVSEGAPGVSNVHFDPWLTTSTNETSAENTAS